MTRLRVSRRTETLPNGTKVVRQKLVEAPVLEWRLQASQVRALRALPEYDREFTLVGGMEAGKRGPQAQIQAQATGLTPGHPDLTLFFAGGRCAFIENKGERGRVSAVQKERHEMLRHLGFDVVVVQTSTESEAAARAVELVRAWLGQPANDNVDRAQIAKLGGAG